MNLSADDKAELAFCNARVLSDTGSFVRYGWTAIVDRCNALGNSGTTLVTNRYYFQKDHLGSIIGLTNDSWALVWEYTYDVYGTAYARTGTGAFEKVSIIGSLYDNDRLFTGREYDGETGLYYLRARYYSADTGRFISRDPIGQVDNLNLYVYVQNNPLRFTDPMGLGSKPMVQKVIDITSSIDPNDLLKAVGNGLQQWGLAVAAVAGPTCVASMEVTTACASVAIVGWPTLSVCAPTAVAAWASCAVAWAGVAVAWAGTYMASMGNGGGGNASPKDKIAWGKQIEDVAQKNGYKDFHAIKKDFLPQNDKSKWDGFFTKEWELYFKRKPLRWEEFEPIFTNLYK